MEAHYVVNDEPRMTGTLSTASSAADALKLQYYEENDDLKAAFGHALSLKDWADICEITETYGAILFSTLLVALALCAAARTAKPWGRKSSRATAQSASATSPPL